MTSGFPMEACPPHLENPESPPIKPLVPPHIQKFWRASRAFPLFYMIIFPNNADLASFWLDIQHNSQYLTTYRTKWPFLPLIIHIFYLLENPPNFVANYAQIPPIGPLSPPFGGTGPPHARICMGNPDQIKQTNWRVTWLKI